MEERGEGSHLRGKPFTFDPTRKRTTGLVRVGEEWFHLSEKYPTLILRPLVEDAIDDTRKQRFQLDQSADMRQAETQLSGATFYSGWSIDEATEGREQILGNRKPPRESDPAARIIPITRLRNYYEILRSFGNRDVCLALVEAANRTPARLDEMFELSYRHFAQYNNVEDAFVEPTAQRASLEAKGKFARDLARKIHDDNGWTADEELAFDYVSYEVSPIRTRMSHFEDGRPATSSGIGGMDLLLRARDSGLPIIGEIKAQRDTNLFLALIQSLMFAVEMTTPAQRQRLNIHHGFHLDIEPHASGPFADVYLLYEDGTDATIKQNVFELTDKLRKLHDSRISRTIRRLVFLECASGDPSSLHRAFVA